MDVIVLADGIDPIKAPEIRAAYGQMIDFDIFAVVNDEVEFGAVD
jgi:hypothetical protein